MSTSGVPAGCGKASRVLVAVDGSDDSRYAAYWAAAKFPGRDVHLVTVVEGASVASQQDAYAAHSAQAMAKCEDSMSAVAKELVSAGLITSEKIHAGTAPTSGRVSSGTDVAKTLLAVVSKGIAGSHIDVLVCGERGAGGLHGAIKTMLGMGTTADYLARHTTVPLVLVPMMVKAAQ